MSKVQVAKWSWYGGPRDNADNDRPALQGATNKVPGIARYNRSTLGHWFRVTGPNGKSIIVQQTDIGPAPWTGKGVDVNYTAVKALGYTEGNFPTGARARVEYLGKKKPMDTQQVSATAPVTSSASTLPTTSSSQPVVQSGGSQDLLAAMIATSASTPPPLLKSLKRLRGI